LKYVLTSTDLEEIQSTKYWPSGLNEAKALSHKEEFKATNYWSNEDSVEWPEVPIDPKKCELGSDLI
jgi:hypothetical protein